MIKPTRARTAYHHGDLKAQLVAAVRGLIETHGPASFSIAEASRLAGVSGAAPYKHFKDRPEILRAVAWDGLDRLRRRMLRESARHAKGSLEAVSAVGLAYVGFARSEPGVFRVMFGLTDGHAEDEALREQGRRTFAVLVDEVSLNLGLSQTSAKVQQRAYMLWSFVHGYSFLTIDGKRSKLADPTDDLGFLMTVCRGLLVDLPGR